VRTPFVILKLDSDQSASYTLKQHKSVDGDEYVVVVAFSEPVGGVNRCNTQPKITPELTD